VPTIFQNGPFRFFFWSNDRPEKPHIHVQRDDKIAKFWLDPVALAESGGFSASELRKLERIVSDEQVRFIEAWHEFFAG
jgi:hypothetical protein